MKIYRIYILGEIPSDLKERISELHAAAILKRPSGETPVHTQKPFNKRSKAGSNPSQ